MTKIECAGPLIVKRADKVEVHITNNYYYNTTPNASNQVSPGPSVVVQEARGPATSPTARSYTRRGAGSRSQANNAQGPETDHPPSSSDEDTESDDSNSDDSDSDSVSNAARDCGLTRAEREIILKYLEDIRVQNYRGAARTFSEQHKASPSTVRKYGAEDIKQISQTRWFRYEVKKLEDQKAARQARMRQKDADRLEQARKRVRFQEAARKEARRMPVHKKGARRSSAAHSYSAFTPYEARFVEAWIEQYGAVTAPEQFEMLYTAFRQAQYRQPHALDPKDRRFRHRTRPTMLKYLQDKYDCPLQTI